MVATFQIFIVDFWTFSGLNIGQKRFLSFLAHSSFFFYNQKCPLLWLAAFSQDDFNRNPTRGKLEGSEVG
jgi:hypothetical protein